MPSIYSSLLNDPPTYEQIISAPSKETDKKITRFQRMCPRCGVTADIIRETVSGIVYCKSCNVVIPAFIVWDLETQSPVCRAWCCRHPKQYRQGIWYLYRLRKIPSYIGDGTYSEATWDTIPGGYKAINRAICTLCLTTLSRRLGSRNMERNDVDWLGKWSGLDVTCTTQGALIMPWEQSKHDSIKSDRKYPLTVDEYLRLPYTVQEVQSQSGKWQALVLELNLKVILPETGKMKAVQDAVREYIQSAMNRNEPVPLPVGMEVYEGKIRRVPGVTGPAVPIQYQRFGKKVEHV